MGAVVSGLLHALPEVISALDAERLRCDLRTAEQRIAEDERTIDQLRQEASAQYDGAKKLHRIIHDLKAQLRQAEVDKARLMTENARLDFAFTCAAEVVRDLEEQLHGCGDVDRKFDRSEAEAIAAEVIS